MVWILVGFRVYSPHSFDSLLDLLGDALLRKRPDAFISTGYLSPEVIANAQDNAHDDTQDNTR